MVPISLPGAVLAGPGGPSARPRVRLGASVGVSWGLVSADFLIFVRLFFGTFFGILFCVSLHVLRPLLLPFGGLFCVILPSRAWQSRPHENPVPVDQIKGPWVWKTCQNALKIGGKNRMRPRSGKLEALAPF